ncbi:MAG: hypothetical protein ACM3SQ_19910 [Betaproteobacteria bacterium]
MRTTLFTAPVVAAAVLLAACGSASAPSGSTPSLPSAPSPATSLTGTWVGTAADSSGSMMGAGMSASMMNAMTWQITETGNTFTGTMQFPGYGGMGMGQGRMTVSGTINGTTATFTMTMPDGSMMSGVCSAVATGTFDFDDLMDQMHGSYSGSNTCTGSFGQGQVSMMRR